jgi:transcription-repair coupling factor (superfamily II helicase)
MSAPLLPLPKLTETPGAHTIGGMADGAMGMALASLYQKGHHPLVFVARDDARLATIQASLRFFLPRTHIITLPAWDCLPYDRISPNASIVAERVQALSQLAHTDNANYLLLTTVNAISQRVPPKEVMANAAFSITVGQTLNREALLTFLANNSYIRSAKTMEPGEFAVRGSILDIFPAGAERGARIDCFGDEVESILRFDPLTQTGDDKEDSLTLQPAGEILLDETHITNFRKGFREAFGAGLNHPLYEAISAGRHYPGMEHWLPLFYEKTDTVFHYLPQNTPIFMDMLADQARSNRAELVKDYYDARHELEQSQMQSALDDAPPYHPLPPNQLYLLDADWQSWTEDRPTYLLDQFQQEGVLSLKLSPTVAMASIRAESRAGGQGELLKRTTQHIKALQSDKTVLVSCHSAGSRERIQTLLQEHGQACQSIGHAHDIHTLTPNHVGLMILPIEQGFLGEGIAVITEQDIFGERIIRATKKKKKASQRFMEEAASISEGELVVHDDHGIGRFAGLETITAGGAPHDCLKILYDGDDRLFVPVENSEVLSRFGTEEEGIKLDKLGGVAWQSRKAKMKERIKLAAEHLLGIAAKRALVKSDQITPPEGAWDEFCARFPYAETEDQLRAIEDVIADLAGKKPMDRLVCGDVGFGKTEVALRAAFMAAYPREGQSRKQVALICPTTLLARQHYQTFVERFKDLPFTIRQISRLASPKQVKETKEMLEAGMVDIVIGTHALLAKDVKFDHLGLLIVDEEQSFGVAQKEKLKELRSGVHVLTLTATPIPRTLQLSLAGIKELSLITTPPVDRLAVRTFITPHDPVTLREAMLREHFRGGKVFYVCPRIKDMEQLAGTLRQLVPEMKIVTAHGQLAAGTLDKVMNDFYDGKYDVLLSTNIIESGLDVPSANTIIVHNAHMFGLAQLYQLRGRVGRGKVRAYAYYTLPHGVSLTPNAVKRLEVMQTLDTLGAGFTLASHDMDIRGFGNVLGDEQSGHIREVGVELYQHMLQEAILKLKQSKEGLPEEDDDSGWSPQINLGMPVLIPEAYVEDLSLRLGLYRRVAQLQTAEELDAFATELVDRFGPTPKELQNLLHVIRIKQICKNAGIERVDTGPKGLIITFRGNKFAKPEALLELISRHREKVKLRTDHKLVIQHQWKSEAERVQRTTESVTEIAQLAA